MDGDLLHKTVSFKLDAADDATGRITGYGSVFGVVDLGGDVVEPGAFSRSLDEHAKAGTRIKMLYEHHRPIGAWDAVSEDRRGLKVSGIPLRDEVPVAREAYALAKHGVVDGLSIGYRIAPGGAYNDSKNVRHLIELKLVEVSLVMEPMNPRARVSAVKSIRELEVRLRDAGFSRREAKALASAGWRGLSEDAERRDADDADEGALAELVAAMDAVTRTLRG